MLHPIDRPDPISGHLSEHAVGSRLRFRIVPATSGEGPRQIDDPFMILGFRIISASLQRMWNSNMLCIAQRASLRCHRDIFHVSRLMLRPKRAYSWTFNCDISSLIVLSFSSSADTSSSIRSVDADSSSCTSDNGSDMKESPIW